MYAVVDAFLLRIYLEIVDKRAYGVSVLWHLRGFVCQKMDGHESNIEEVFALLRMLCWGGSIVQNCEPFS